MKKQAQKNQNNLVLEFPLEEEQVISATVPSPHGPVRIHHLYCLVHQIPFDKIPTKSNPRSHPEEILKTGLCREIKKSLLEFPEEYVFNSRGGTMLVDSFKFDKETKTAQIVISDIETQGLIDGATNAKILEVLTREMKKGKEANKTGSDKLDNTRFHLEILEGIHNKAKISDLSTARNTSRQLKSFSMESFKGTLDFLKNILEKGPFKGKIAWDEYARGVSIVDILAVINLMHPHYDKQTDDGNAPTISYSSKSKVIEKLDNEDFLKGFKNLAPLVEDILSLHDYIYITFPETYEKAFAKTKLGRRVGFNPRHDNPIVLPLTGAKAEYEIASSFIMPILASLRALIKYDGDIPSWTRPPIEFFNQYGPNLVRSIIQHSNRVGSPTMLGKDKTTYESLHKDVRLLLMEK